MFLKKQIIAIVSMKAMVVICIALCACTPRSLREAQEVVAQADSLWHEGKIYGVDGGDSATLAQAYKTLEAIPLPFREGLGLGSPYAHACYHYGKLLRAKENPVEAMQTFIAATHSGTKDYHILGRVYSNMGDICHLASEFSLAYDMYERSGEMYLRNGDSLLYYYDLNNMAFEKAYLADKQETYRLLRCINNSCTDKEMLNKTLETRAELSLRIKEYDSAVYYINQLQKHGYCETAGMLIKAQAFSYKLCKDSAVYYSERVLKGNHTLHEANNALYILTTQDETQDKNSIRSVAANRSDVQKMIEEERSKSAQAVQLLEQDLARKPDYQWIYAIIGVILFACSCAILYYIWRKRKEHSRILHEIDIKQEQKTQLETNIVAMHSEISQLSEQQQKTHQHLLSNIEAACSTLRNSKDVLSELCWKDYTQMCAITNNLFNKLADSLQEKGLSEREVRLCILVLINCYSDKQMANILLYGENSIPVMGLPGCVMYAKRTIFDIVLPRIMTGEILEKADFDSLGEGGLCLNCGVCTFPDCGFGKGGH